MEADQKKAQHEAAREKAEADQKNAEARRAADEKEKERLKFENERNVRFANALKIGADFTIDYTSEAAWAEQAFISNEGRYRARKFSLSDGAAQTALRAEYARLMRMLSGGKTISRNDYVQMFVGAVALGRVRVASKIFDKVRDVNVVSSFDPRKRTLLMWALEGLDEETLAGFMPPGDTIKISARPDGTNVLMCIRLKQNAGFSADTNKLAACDFRSLRLHLDENGELHFSVDKAFAKQREILVGWMSFALYYGFEIDGAETYGLVNLGMALKNPFLVRNMGTDPV